MVVKLLLEKAVDVDYENGNSNDRTPLLYAAANRHKAEVRQLLENAVNVDSKDAEYGRTAKNGYGAVVKLLLEGCRCGLQGYI
jgi:ankyrin repeat protein